MSEPSSKLLAHLSRRQAPGSRRRRPHFSKISETAWPVKAKFKKKHLWEGGINQGVYINNPGHMTNMNAMPIYGKTLQKFFPPNRWTYFDETWHVAYVLKALL